MRMKKRILTILSIQIDPAVNTLNTSTLLAVFICIYLYVCKFFSKLY